MVYAGYIPESLDNDGPDFIGDGGKFLISLIAHIFLKSLLEFIEVACRFKLNFPNTIILNAFDEWLVYLKATVVENFNYSHGFLFKLRINDRTTQAHPPLEITSFLI